MTKTEWQIKDDDKGHLNTFLFNGEWGTRMGNGNTTEKSEMKLLIFYQNQEA